MSRITCSVMLSVATLFWACAGQARASIIDFEDLSAELTHDYYDDIADSYNGFTWSELWRYTNGADYDEVTGKDSGYDATGSMVAFNAKGEPVSVSSETDFDFIGAVFSAAWEDCTITIAGLNDGVTLYSTTINVITGEAVWSELDWYGIDELVFSASSENDPTEIFVMDNFTTSSPAPVPEPATLILLGSGLICLAVTGRKFLGR